MCSNRLRKKQQFLLAAVLAARLAGVLAGVFAFAGVFAGVFGAIAHGVQVVGQIEFTRSIQISTAGVRKSKKHSAEFALKQQVQKKREKVPSSEKK